MTSNIETIPGFTITKSWGVVSGSTVRAKHIGKDILAPKSLWYEKLDEETDHVIYEDGYAVAQKGQPGKGNLEATPETFLKPVCITYFFIS